MEINKEIYNKIISRDQDEIIKIINFLISEDINKITYKDLEKIQEEAIKNFLLKLSKSLKDEKITSIDTTSLLIDEKSFINVIKTEEKN